MDHIPKGGNKVTIGLAKYAMLLVEDSYWMEDFHNFMLLVRSVVEGVMHGRLCVFLVLFSSAQKKLKNNKTAS